MRARAISVAWLSFAIVAACGGSDDSNAPAADSGVVVDGAIDAPGSDTRTGDVSPIDAAHDGGGDASGDGGTAYWRPFADTSPWNTPISASPAIDPDSATMIADLTAITDPFGPPGGVFTSFDVNIAQYSIPVYFVDASTPRVKVTTTSVANGDFHTSDVPAVAMVPIPAGATPAAGTDKHLCLIDKAAHHEWDFWNSGPVSDGWTCAVCATIDTDGSGVRPPRDAPGIDWWDPIGSRACGFPLIAGLITRDDVKSGHIRHALVWAYPHIRTRWYRPPASTAQQDSGEAISTRGIPCGGLVQLDPTIDVSTLGLSPTATMIARALQEYDAYVGDYSGSLSLYADASPDAQAYWGSGVLSSGDVDKIPIDKLRVLDLGTLKYDGP